MNHLTKRVPRRPDDRQMTVAHETLAAFDTQLDERVISSIYHAMVSAAPVDPMEQELERIHADRTEAAA